VYKDIVMSLSRVHSGLLLLENKLRSLKYFNYIVFNEMAVDLLRISYFTTIVREHLN